MVSVQAPTASTPWLLGGNTVSPSGVNMVAIWSASGPGGPWRRDGLLPVPGRDGPNETILGFAAGEALGSRHSPTEGYPRPSAWVRATTGTWVEVLEPREMFGGPDIVAIGDESDGGITAGSHGFHVAGAWIGPGDRVVAAVWAAPEGATWTRDDTNQAFTAGATTQSYGYDIADGPDGLLMVGTVSVPTHAHPTAQVGAIWYSPDGIRWAHTAQLGGAGQTVLASVRAVGDSWVAGGQRTTAGVSTPTVWYVTASRAPSAHTLPGVDSAVVDDLAVTSTEVVAAGHTDDGTAVLWAAPRHGDAIGGWRLLQAPPTGPRWDSARVAATPSATVLVVFDGSRSEVWQTG